MKDINRRYYQTLWFLAYLRTSQIQMLWFQMYWPTHNLWHSIRYIHLQFYQKVYRNNLVVYQILPSLYSLIWHNFFAKGHVFLIQTNFISSFLLSDGVSYFIFLNSNLSIGRFFRALFVGLFQTQGLDVQATSSWSRLPVASSSENNKPDIWVHPSPNLR